MNLLADALFEFPAVSHVVDAMVRLVMAALLGGVLGAERELVGKAAGLRTHMLVAMGAAMFVLLPLENGMAAADVSRVIQGVATGIGFIGAGAILKLRQREEIIGLTTAANLWFTAAIGIAVGVGHLWLPVVGVLCGWLVLAVVARVERRISARRAAQTADAEGRRPA